MASLSETASSTQADVSASRVRVGLEHESCAVCFGPTEFDIDATMDGRGAVVSPIGKTIKCSDCSEYVCGECVSATDPTVCANCRACAECCEDAGERPAAVLRGSWIPWSPWQSRNQRDLLCVHCLRTRVINEAARALEQSADDREAHATIVSYALSLLAEHFGFTVSQQPSSVAA